MRLGKWKAVRPAVDQPVQLYDLAADIGETRDVAAANPEVVARIGRIMKEAHVDSTEFPLVKGGAPGG